MPVQADNSEHINWLLIKQKLYDEHMFTLGILITTTSDMLRDRPQSEKAIVLFNRLRARIDKVSKFELLHPDAFTATPPSHNLLPGKDKNPVARII